MGILVVDDSEDELRLLGQLLNKAGHKQIILAKSAMKAFDMLKKINPEDICLILMDIQMPGMTGIEACYKLKADERLKDIPIVMVSALNEIEQLQAAFSAGAVDFIPKPVKKIELLARVSSVLRLKYEMDHRKSREKDLEALTRKLADTNKVLERLSVTDSLTGIANRRYFDVAIDHELLRSTRGKSPLSLIFIDIDFFKGYNDTYGHVSGDECLSKVANALKTALKRPADLVARYGGEEFAVLLPETEIKGAVVLAESMRQQVAELDIPHMNSSAASHVTISLGVAYTLSGNNSSASLIEMADKALYKAKEYGRNRVETMEE